MSLPSFNALRAFESAARLGGVSRAAQELHVTHSAVSKQIHALEETLGIPLFRRQGRRLVLTAAGQTLFDAATHAIAQLRDAYAELRRTTSQAPLVLGCPGSLMARWIIPRLERLNRVLPAMKLHLSVNDAIPEVSLPSVDAALLSLAPPWPTSWKVHPLGTERIGPVVSPRWPEIARLRHASALAVKDIPLLYTSSRPQAWPTWATANTIDPSDLTMGIGFEHLSYLLEAAIAGLGIAIAPEPLVTTDIAAGRLIAPWGFIATQAQWLLCALAQNADPRISALANWMRQELRISTQAE